MSQTPTQQPAQQQMPAQMAAAQQQPQHPQNAQMNMLMQNMNPAALQQLSGQSQELQSMMMNQQTRQNAGHQDGQRPREPRERLPSVYVGNLPKDYYQLDLYKHVKQMGYGVYQAVINVDKQTKRQNRYGFLQFFKLDEAKRCASELNNTKIGNNYIRCNLQEGNFMEPKANVLVRYIDLAVTQQEFFDKFSAVGPVRSCKLELYPDGKARGFGYIQFETEESATAAIAKTGEIEFNGKKVEVLTHQRREERQGEARGFLNLFVQGLEAGTDDTKLSAMFAEFGEIQSAHVQRVGDAGDELTNKGYVSFKSGDSAQAAIDAMHKKQNDDKTYLLVSQHISKRENQVAAQTANSATIQSSMRRTYESNLFVKNIPSEITEVELTALFEEIGAVISIKLRQGKYFNPQAAYRQYFVLYKDIESAKRAIQRFDQSTPFGARALSVQFWMPTQELHQEREQRSFNEVQQYFMKNLYSMSGQNNQYGGMGGDGRQMSRGDGQQRQGYQGQRPYQNRGGQDGRQDGRQGGQKPFNNRGGPRNNMRQGSGRDQMFTQGAQPGAPAQSMQAMTPEQAAGMQQQLISQQSGAQPSFLPQVDTMRLQQLDPAERRQEIGNTIYNVIQQQYGDAAGKITGMLLDNDRIVDPMQLVSNVQYLQQKAHEAWTLLQQQPDPAMAGQQMTAPPQQTAQ